MPSTQRLATLMDGMTRHSPEGVGFQARSAEIGFQAAVKERDTGSFEFNIHKQSNAAKSSASDSNSAAAAAAAAASVSKSGRAKDVGPAVYAPRAPTQQLSSKL